LAGTSAVDKIGLKRIDHEVVDRDRKRVYIIGGEELELASVTQRLKIINKPGLNAWRVKMGKEEGDRVRDETSEYGRAVHAAVKRIIDGKGFGAYEWSLDKFTAGKVEYPLVEPVKNGIRAFVQFKKSHTLEPVAAEFFVYSRLYEFAGTFDLLGNIDELLTLADYKTGGLYPEVWLQLAAYRQALWECYGVKVDQLMRIQLSRETAQHECDVLTGSDMDDAFAAYLHAQHLGEYLERQGGIYW